jgi:alpha-2-macroglobulin
MRFFGALSLVLLALLSPAMAQKAYVNQELAKSALLLENSIKAMKYTGLPKTEDLIRDAGLALNKNEALVGLELAQKAAFSAPQLSQPWRVMARGLLAINTQISSEKSANGQKARQAAYLGYLKATTVPEEALSLSFMAQANEHLGEYRQAMTLYRQSIALESRLDRVKRYEDLIEKYGFRVTNTVITTNQASPSACFTFSTPVKKSTDFTPYVVVQGAKGDFAITSEAQQVCVEGLKHGEKYNIILRQGLPAEETDEALRKAGDYQIYVRDRTPTLRFTGRNYVLPTVGQTGVPLVSINTTKIDLTLLRIGDRNLIHSVQSSEFMAQTDGETMRILIDEKGEKIWQGKVETKGETNKEHTTAIPISEIMGAMKPGLYILTAKTEEQNNEDYYFPQAAQWFIVSDIGITSFMGADGVHIIAKSLATAKPLSGVSLRLIARNNEVLGTVTTDASGYAKFDAGLSKGYGGASPAMVTASIKEDYAFLDLKQAAFDFSGRGLKGRTPPVGLDAFISTERGVYRGGETVFATVLVRDARSQAVPNLPVTVIIKRPDGVEFKREVLNDAGAGGRALTLPLIKGVAAGIWRLRVHSDVKLDPIGETSFMVEDYVPEKLDLVLAADKPDLRDKAAVTMSVKHLYGAPASDLATEGSVTFKAVSTAIIPGFDGYSYGLMDEKFTTITKEIDDAPRTDEKGVAIIQVSAPENVTRPMEAEVTLRAGEAGGRFISRSLTMPVLPNSPVIAIKKRFKEGELADGVNAEFDVIALTGEGKLIAQNATWKLVRFSNAYQYYYANGSWNYEVNKSANRVADGKIALTTQGAAKISAPISWGNYRLELRAGALESAVTFSVGEELDRSADAPDMLDITLDKKEVLAGNKIKVTLNSRFNGTASLVLMADKLTFFREIDVSSKGTTVEIETSAAWNTSNWLAVIAHRPLDIAAKRLPGRAIGLAHIAVDIAPKTIEVSLDAPKSHTPRKDLNLTLKTNAQPGEEVFVTVAAVDLGILNLTRFQSPDPVAHYYGARLSGFETRDLYGFLIDGMQGTKGALRTGGDSTATKGTEGDVPDNPPLAYFSGVVKVGADGMAKLAIPVPAFNGTMRVMATAWSGKRVGKASSDVLVLDPVVMAVTLPRFLTLGDQSRMHVALHNIDGPAGDYTFTVTHEEKPRVLKLAKGAKTEFSVPYTATHMGKVNFVLQLSTTGLEINDTRTITVNPTAIAQSRRTVEGLVKDQIFRINPEILKDFYQESARVSLSVAPHASLDTAAMLSSLLTYPYACSEQTVSAAMPLLSLPNGMMDETEKRERITAAIAKLLSRQGSNGAFGLWSMPNMDDEGDVWLDAFVTEFLVRAKEKGQAVPAIALDLALDRLRNKFVNAEGYLEKDTPGLAYAGYILARAGRPILGDLRYVNDSKLASFTSPLSKAHIGAGLAMLGDRTRAGQTFEVALNLALGKKEDQFSRPDYGSLLRDTAGITALISENGGNNAQILKGLASIDALRGTRYLSTQENMRLMMAAFSLQKPAESIVLNVNDKPHSGTYSVSFSAKELAIAPQTIVNKGADSQQIAMTITGVPLKPEPAIAKGFSLSTQSYSLTGEKIASSAHKVNQRYIIKVTASEVNPRFGRVMVVDPVPAGFEIENIKLVEGAGLEGYAWLKISDKPTMTEVRDDRYLASFDRHEGSPKEFSFAYLVRAVAPGRYITPASHVEDMYRPDRYATTSAGVTTIAP